MTKEVAVAEGVEAITKAVGNHAVPVLLVAVLNEWKA